MPEIRNCEVAESKPAVSDIIEDLTMVDGATIGGGLGIAASGPESLTSDARNAVAALGPLKARRLGGVELHTEAYTL